MLPEFELLLPKTLPEALGLLAAHAPDVAPLAGGTNLVPDLRSGRHTPPVLVNVERLPGLGELRRDDGHLILGGGVTLTEVLKSALIAEQAPVLHQAAAVFANPLVRNRATVGGNLADASPAADTAPALLVLDAEVELTSQAGTRTVPLHEFFTGVRKTVRRPDELITTLRWPVLPPHTITAFHKIGLRKADAIAVINAAVRVTTDGAGRCREARIALGAVAPTPLRIPTAEAVLQDQPLTPAVIAEAARLAAEAVTPISDVRGGAGYRRRMAEVLVRRLLTAAAGGA